MSDVSRAPDPLELDGAARGSLARWLARRLPEAGELRAVRRFGGGYSNVTYGLATDAGELVLRRPPPGPLAAGAHDVAREFDALGAVHPVFAKAPRPLAYCADEAVIGAPFFVMEAVAGRILRAATLKREGVPPAAAMTAASHAAAATLAELHGLRLGDEAIASARAEGYVVRQLEGWARRFAQARTPDVQEAADVVDWLRGGIIADHAGAPVHGDFKFDNLVFDAGDFAAVRGVLDWEMCTIGHPLLDLGLTLAYWAHPEEVRAVPFLGVNCTHLPGCLRRDEFVAAYREATERGVGADASASASAGAGAGAGEFDEGSIAWAYVFGNLKLAGIAQQLYARYAAGHTRDERFGALGAVANYLVERGRDAAASGRYA